MVIFLTHNHFWYVSFLPMPWVIGSAKNPSSRCFPDRQVLKNTNRKRETWRLKMFLKLTKSSLLSKVSTFGSMDALPKTSTTSFEREKVTFKNQIQESKKDWRQNLYWNISQLLTINKIRISFSWLNMHKWKLILSIIMDPLKTKIQKILHCLFSLWDKDKPHQSQI